MGKTKFCQIIGDGSDDVLDIERINRKIKVTISNDMMYSGTLTITKLNTLNELIAELENARELLKGEIKNGI